MSDDVSKFLDPYDDTALLVDGNRLVVSMHKVFQRVEMGLERIHMDPTSGGSLGDLFDGDTLGWLVVAGMGPPVAVYVAECSAGILNRHRPEEAASLNLDLLDPVASGRAVNPASLDIAKAMIRQAVAPHPKGHHPAGCLCRRGSKITAAALDPDNAAMVADVLVVLLMFHVSACATLT